MAIVRYFQTFYKHLGFGIIGAMFLSILASLLESIGIVLVLPLLAGIDSEDSVINGYLRSAFDFFTIPYSVNSIILLIMVVFLFKGLLSFLSLAEIARLRGRLLKKLKLGLFDSVTAVEYQYSTSKDSGYFSNLINEQVVKSLQSFYSFSQFISQVINAFAYVSFALLVAFKFGVIAIASGFFLLFTFQKLNAYVYDISKERAHESGYLAAKLIEFIQSLKYIKATGQSDKLGKHVRVSIDKLTDLEIKNGIATALTQSLREPIAVLLIMSLIFVHTYYFNESLAPMLVSIMFFYRSLNAFFSIQGYWQSTIENMGSMELVDLEKKVLDLNKETGGYSEIKFKNEIRLDSVNFQYKDYQTDILKNISIVIKKGQTVAFVGHSGSGKSTLVDVIMGILSPTSGHILIDDISLSEENIENWRGKVGLVPQFPVLFKGSINSNIDMRFEHHHTDNGKIKKFAKKAYIDGFIESLPLKYDTNVGENGIHLSGGQRQRVCIARELYRETELLVFDEATSALDYESERMIQESIDSLSGKATAIIIAHRLSTVMNADVIYVLENGRIVEYGSYQKLISQSNSIFSNLVNKMPKNK
jgi:ABC-type multidrug transport system fused ATPase/permease subunit